MRSGLAVNLGSSRVTVAASNLKPRCLHSYPPGLEALESLGPEDSWYCEYSKPDRVIYNYAARARRDCQSLSRAAFTKTKGKKHYTTPEESSCVIEAVN